jgi:hypothetical protein
MAEKSIRGLRVRAATLFKTISYFLRLAAVVIGGSYGFLIGSLIGEFGRSDISGYAIPTWAPLVTGSLTIVGAYLGWKLTTWMTRNLDLSYEGDEKPSVNKNVIRAHAWFGAGLCAFGLLIPVLSLPALFSCSDECHGFALLIPLSGIFALTGAIDLATVADQGSIGPKIEPWKHLFSNGWPSQLVPKFGLYAAVIAMTLVLMATIDLPPPIGILWSGATLWLGVCIWGLARIDQATARTLIGDRRILLIDLRPIVVFLLGIVSLEAVLLLIVSDRWLARF